MRGKVKKDTIIGDLIKKHPEAADILFSHGMHCVGCHVAAWETIEQAAITHGISKEELETMINKLNRVVKRRR